MKKITLLWFGKTSDKNIDALIKMYQKKLNPLLQLEIKEIKEPKIQDLQSKLKAESKLLINLVPSSAKTFILDEKGKNFTSKELSNKIEKICLNGVNHICFIIGSAYGFHESIYKQNFEMLSLSKMTFTHDMVRVFALEQIYRCEMIARNTGYHH